MLRIISLLLIFCVAFALAYASGYIWEFAERHIHPQDFGDSVSKYSFLYNVPEYVIYSVIKVESDFESDAISSAGAMGLMQMMPSTFEWLTADEHLREYLQVNDIYDPDVSIRYGTYYLSYLYNKFDCNWNTALAAYNAGEGNVAKWLADPQYSDGQGNLTYIPFPETRSYVKKVNKEIAAYKKLYYEDKGEVLA